MGVVFCTTSCQYREREQTSSSKLLRISFFVLGVLFITAGALNLAGINAFSQFGSQAGQAFLNVGISALLLTSFKCVKNTQESAVKAKGIPKPGAEFLTQFPAWMRCHLESSDYCEVADHAKVLGTLKNLDHPFITFHLKSGEYGFGLRLDVNHINSHPELNKRHDNIDFASPFVLLTTVTNNNNKWVHQSDIWGGRSQYDKVIKCNTISHRGENIDGDDILTGYMAHNDLNKTSRNALTKYIDQSHSSLDPLYCFSLEWLLLNLWVNGKVYINECRKNGYNEELITIGHWELSFKNVLP